MKWSMVMSVLVPASRFCFLSQGGVLVPMGDDEGSCHNPR
jgi:hypothetical protein